MTDNPVPMPLRAAAGLAALAFDEARRLPRRLVGLPVLAVSGAMQASLRVQQGYTQLAVRGDEVLAQLRPGADDETPPWARFDEDDGPDPGDRPASPGEPSHPAAANGTNGASALPLADYDRLSLPQLRNRLRALSPGDVERLVHHERETAHRAPYLTVLENHLVALRGE